MATRQVLKEEFLTCIICHEMFRDPVTLHCGHTHCSQCVTAYTKTQKNAIKQGYIACPHCRGLTKVPDPKTSVDEWTGQLKTGFFVKGLVEKFAPTSKDDDDDDSCTLCKDDGEMKPAAVWCSDCGHSLKCESVILLDDALSKIDPILEQYKNHVDTEVPEEQTEVSAHQTSMDKLLSSAAHAETKLDAVSEKLVSAIREKQKLLKAELNSRKHAELQRIQEDMKSGEIRLEEVKQRQSFLKGALESEDVYKRYQAYKMLSNRDHAMEREPEIKRSLELIFSDTSEAILQLIHRDNFGSIHDRTRRFKIKPRLLTKWKTDLSDVSGIAVMYPRGIKTIVISSTLSRCIISFPVSKGISQETCRTLQCEHYPYGITKISDKRAAVSLFTSQIVFFSIDPQLKQENTIQTQRQYTDLAFLNTSTLAASAKSPGCIDIIDTTGTVIRSFGIGMLDVPRYISAAKNNCLLLSDTGKRSVMCLNHCGQVQFIYQPTKATYPGGVCQSSTGEVFVGDTKNNRVIEITANGEYVGDLLGESDGIHRPCMVFLDGNQMYISVSRGVINVYQFKQG